MSWYILGFLVVTFIINHVVLSLGFIDLSYQFTVKAKEYEIGEEIPVVSVVENNKLLTVSYLKIEEYFPPSFNVAKNIYSVFILPFQRVKRTYKIHAGKRGLYWIQEAVLELGDFIGFKSKRRRIAFHEEIVVLPRKLNLKESIVPLGLLEGDISVRRWLFDDPLMTIGVREYTGTEPQRFIHWPSSAKHSSLMVKKFDFTTDNSALVLLNVEAMKPCGLPIEEELIDKAVSIARGVVEELEKLSIPYGLMTNAYNEQMSEHGYYLRTGLGPSHLGALLRVLGSIHFRIPGFFEKTLATVLGSGGNYTTLVVVTPRILESYLEPFDLLAMSVPRLAVISLEGEHLEALPENIIKYRGKENV